MINYVANLTEVYIFFELPQNNFSLAQTSLLFVLGQLKALVQISCFVYLQN